ncbi:MAG: ERF family protein [Lachnospiraceae bacterium]|nr:ERF family protein [Lachnospiraceae bacterium]
MLKIQKALSAPKNKRAEKYKYRSAEDLYEKIKPLLESELNITTSLIEMSGRVFVEAAVRYKNATAKGYAELENSPRNMSIGQATGAATSYAIKYAICMLFLVDNGEDLDGRESALSKEEQEKTPKQQLFEKLESKGVGREEMKAFYETYCPNETMLGRVVVNFDRFLAEWINGDKKRVFK